MQTRAGCYRRLLCRILCRTAAVRRSAIVYALNGPQNIRTGDLQVILPRHGSAIAHPAGHYYYILLSLAALVTGRNP